MAATPSAFPAIEEVLDSLDPEQRAAASLPDGPAQIIAPAGSGKTTTMVARLGVLLSRGVPADRICVVTFNRDAARDLAARVERKLGGSIGEGTAIEIRTLHALARQVLLGAGEGRDIVADRLPLIRAARRRVAATTTEPLHEPAQLDTWLSAWKVEGRDPPPEVLPTLETYAKLLRDRGAVDFDDLVVRAAELLATDPRTRLAWQSRFSHVCVDEFQDVDAAQLRLVRLLAAPEDNLFVVGDDDQTIYAWRLADVKYTPSQQSRDYSPVGESSRRAHFGQRSAPTGGSGWRAVGGCISPQEVCMASTAELALDVIASTRCQRSSTSAQPR